MLSCPLCTLQAKLLSHLTDFHAGWYEIAKLKVRRMPHFIFPRIINGNVANMREFQAGAI
jgi:hypothetical protein